MSLRFIKEFNKKWEDKGSEAKDASQDFDNWFKGTNHPKDLKHQEIFEIWFYEVDKGKKSLSRFNRILDNVKKIKQGSKKAYDFHVEFSEGDYSNQLAVRIAVNEFNNWNQAHRDYYKNLDKGSFVNNFNFWFMNIYNKKNQYNHSRYVDVARQVNSLTLGKFIDIKDLYTETAFKDEIKQKIKANKPKEKESKKEDESLEEEVNLSIVDTDQNPTQKNSQF